MNMLPERKSAAAATSGVLAAIGSALCCVGPLVAVVLGVSGAGLASTFEPLRPFFLVGAAASLGWGWVTVKREEHLACEPGRPCASPVARRRMKRWLIVATLLVLVLATFPLWSRYVLS
jgi:mercuric ion transport protein